MSRIRTIKPEWLDDEKILSLEDSARVLSIALILLADDHGNGRANVNVIAGKVFPFADGSEVAKKSLEALASIGFIKLYVVRGQHYYSIVHWTKHQRIDHPSKPQVPCPEPDEFTEDIPENPEKQAHSRNTRETLANRARAQDRDRDQEGDQEFFLSGAHESAHAGARACVREGQNKKDSVPDSREPEVPDRLAEAQRKLLAAREAIKAGGPKPRQPSDPEAEQLAVAINEIHIAATGVADKPDTRNKLIFKQLRAAIDWAKLHAKDNWLAAARDSYTSYLKSNGKIREDGYPLSYWANEPARFLVASGDSRDEAHENVLKMKRELGIE